MTANEMLNCHIYSFKCKSWMKQPLTDRLWSTCFPLLNHRHYTFIRFLVQDIIHTWMTAINEINKCIEVQYSYFTMYASNPAWYATETLRWTLSIASLYTLISVYEIGFQCTFRLCKSLSLMCRLRPWHRSQMRRTRRWFAKANKHRLWLIRKRPLYSDKKIGRASSINYWSSIVVCITNCNRCRSDEQFMKQSHQARQQSHRWISETFNSIHLLECSSY